MIKKTKSKSKVKSECNKTESQINEMKLENMMTIDKSQAFKERIIDAYKRNKHIKLLFKECVAPDLSAIQLLYSLYRTAKKENKTVLIDLHISKEQKELFKNTGIYNKYFTGEIENKLILSNKS
ncbi:MAG: hypothetical protein JSV22_00330 [Bacteroidales bacterium]|nr:MAG: hypothetical protein JSV22_00330 [Bacteroidales bacterium]